MDLPAKRPSTLPRSAYSREEVRDMYELGKLWLETGLHKRAEAIMTGLNEVAPDFAPAWLGTAFLRGSQLDYDGVVSAATAALRLEPDCVEAMLFLVIAALALKDLSMAGTYLGEVGDRVEQGQLSNPNVLRLYKMQLSRYQNRD